MSKLKRKKKTIGLIQGYLKGKILSEHHESLMARLKLIQRAIKEKLKSFKMQKKIKNMMIMQIYVKKEVARRNRLKYTRSL
jgi:hypothetical protein